MGKACCRRFVYFLGRHSPSLVLVIDHLGSQSLLSPVPKEVREDRAFATAAPHSWKSSPLHIQTSSSNSIILFKSQPKTHLMPLSSSLYMKMHFPCHFGICWFLNSIFFYCIFVEECGVVYTSQLKIFILI